MRTLNCFRCKLWVKYSGNEDLLKFPSTDLHLKKYLCGAHFSSQQFYNASRKRLLPNAVPDVSHNIMLDDNQMDLFPVLGKKDLQEGKRINIQCCV